MLFPGFELLNFCQENCECEEGEYNLSIYGVYVPCIHQIFLPIKALIEKIDQMMSRRRWGFPLKLIFRRIMNSGFLLDAITHQNGEKVFEQIVNIYSPSNLPMDDIAELITQIISCFNYQKLPNEKVDINVLTHKLEIGFCDENLEEPDEPTEDQPKTSIPYDVDGDDDSIDSVVDKVLMQEKPQFMNFRVKIVLQTLSEIQKIYPKTKHDNTAFMICLSQYTQHLEQINDIDTFKLNIPSYKNSCWALADQLQGEHKFFQIIEP